MCVYERNFQIYDIMLLHLKLLICFVLPRLSVQSETQKIIEIYAKTLYAKLHIWSSRVLNQNNYEWAKQTKFLLALTTTFKQL